eukprot:362906-Chlamydomonas_euryale.AAC.8
MRRVGPFRAFVGDGLCASDPPGSWPAMPEGAWHGTRKRGTPCVQIRPPPAVLIPHPVPACIQHA